MIRRPPRSTLSSSSAASDVYKRQREAVGGAGRVRDDVLRGRVVVLVVHAHHEGAVDVGARHREDDLLRACVEVHLALGCLLYTSDAADEEDSVDLGGRRI